MLTECTHPATAAARAAAISSMQVVLAAVSDAFRLRQRPPRPEDPLDRETPSTPSPEEEAALAAVLTSWSTFSKTLNLEEKISRG